MSYIGVVSSESEGGYGIAPLLEEAGIRNFKELKTEEEILDFINFIVYTISQ